MTTKRVYIAGIGIISPLGRGLGATKEALRRNRSAIRPLDIFALLSGKPLPAGQVGGLDESGDMPRTHRLASIAASEAMAGIKRPPDAIIIGTTTGGILTTEQLLRDRITDKKRYRYHGLHSVAEQLAEEVDCAGPALTVSTACSSGAAALAMALAMLRRGKAAAVLAGGVDSLCRLTYFGFHSLQLVDREGCRPLDRDRRGMSVAEGAAMLLLTTEKPERPLAELLGAGLSCDAYHPAAPHPEGRGALTAMRAALANGGLAPADIDYINLHGTGTLENDQAEAKAVISLFGTAPPPLSSIKGATGHSLAASGAIEGVVAALAVSDHLLPANTGWQHQDPALGLMPVTSPENKPVRAVLSNSFGFGGNNGSLIITGPDTFPCPPPRDVPSSLAVHGWSCLTGAGASADVMSMLSQGKGIAGITPAETISEKLQPQLVRRLKRLSRMTLALAIDAHEHSELIDKPDSIVVGTGWGALTETYDFLSRLTETDEQFPSPTDFVGSVHNGPAGQAAIMFGSTGANLTVSGGDYSFEQALLTAELMAGDPDKSTLILGVDECHRVLSPLLDPSITSGAPEADGGGALCLSRKSENAACLVRVPFYRRYTAETCIDMLIAGLEESTALKGRHALLMAGIPAAVKEQGELQLARFLRLSGLQVPVVRYRDYTGDFASASAVAAVMAVDFLASGTVPGKLFEGDDIHLGDGPGAVLVLGLGSYITAMEFYRP